MGARVTGASAIAVTVLVLAACGSTTLGTADGAAGSSGAAGSGAAGSNNAACPLLYGPIPASTPCPATESPICDYGEGRCECLPCQAGGNVWSRQWVCRAWNTGGDGCPPRSPPEGSACPTSGQFCTYGGFCNVSVGDNLQCVSGKWQKMPSPVGSCAAGMCRQ